MNDQKIPTVPEAAEELRALLEAHLLAEDLRGLDELLAHARTLDAANGLAALAHAAAEACMQHGATRHPLRDALRAYGERLMAAAVHLEAPTAGPDADTVDATGGGLTAVVETVTGELLSDHGECSFCGDDTVVAVEAEEGNPKICAACAFVALQAIAGEPSAPAEEVPPAPAPMPLERAQEIVVQCRRELMWRNFGIGEREERLPDVSLEELAAANRLVAEDNERQAAAAAPDEKGHRTYRVQPHVDPRAIALAYAFEHYDRDPLMLLEALGLRIVVPIPGHEDGPVPATREGSPS